MALWNAGTAAIPEIDDLGAGALTRRLNALAALLGSLAVSAFLALLTVAAVEIVTRGSVEKTYAFLTNPNQPGWTTLGVFFLVFLAVDALIGRKHKAVLVVAPLMLAMGVISQQKQVFLTDPLYPTDLLFGRQILELMPALVAERPWTAAGLALGTVAALGALAGLWVYAWRRLRPLSAMERICRLALALPLLAGFASIMDFNDFSALRDRLKIYPILWDQAENYRHNGFAMAFAINLPMANVKAPAGYSAEAIDRIPAEILPAGTRDGQKPDVIVLMSESLWDPTRLEKVKFSADPMPVIRENSGGHVFSPEFGGLTANIEFEALTGFSNAFLPTGSIPYQQYVRKPVPSLATFFRGEGYATRAIHPFRGWFWNRTNVYEAFGFDTFKDVDAMPPLEKHGNFTADDALTKEIIRQAEAEQGPFFFFAVTLQGHGPYEAGRYGENTIGVEGPLTHRETQMLATYSEGVKQADDSLKLLMDWAAARERETIIVIFGDHLPPLNTVYKSAGYMPGVTASRKGTPEQMKKEHETPLVIWSNRTGPQENIGTVSPAFLPYHILKEAGYEHPYYTGFLGGMREHFSVVDRYMLIDAEGRAKADWSRTGPADPQIRDFRLLQHDMMFGDQHALPRFFPSRAGALQAYRGL